MAGAVVGLDEQLPIVAGERRRDEVVGVVFDQRDPRLVLREHSPGEVGRNRQHAVDASVPQVRRAPRPGRVVDGVEQSACPPATAPASSRTLTAGTPWS